MPLIEIKKQRKAETRYDFLDADENGMVTSVTSIETTGHLAEGDLCDVHLCDFNGLPAVIKIPRHKRDSDLVSNEATVLQALCPLGNWHEKFHRYLPQLLLTDSNEDLGTFNVFPYYKDWITLAEVLAAYPNGIDFRDAIWMYKRALVALGFVHEQGFVYGSAIPEHFIVHPEHHGGKFLDWSYATRIQDGKHLAAISTRNQAYYPSEVWERRPVHATLDIFMMTKVMVRLLGGDVTTNEMPSTVPEPFQVVFKRALSQDFKRRPQNAWDFHAELDEILKTVVGPPQYRPFKMPVLGP